MPIIYHRMLEIQRPGHAETAWPTHQARVIVNIAKALHLVLSVSVWCLCLYANQALNTNCTKIPCSARDKQENFRYSLHAFQC